MVRKITRNLLEFATPDGISEDERNKLNLLNEMIITFLPVIAVFAFLFAYKSLWFSAVMISAIGVLHIVCLFLNHFSYTKTTRILQTSLPLLISYLIIVFEIPVVDHVLMFFSIYASAFIVLSAFYFSFSEYSFIIINILLTIFYIVSLDYAGDLFLDRENEIVNSSVFVVMLFVTAFGMLLTAVLYFKKINHLYLREIVNQNLKITVKNIKINEQKAAIEKQRDVEVRYRKQLTENISYAKYIQYSILPSSSQFEKIFSNSFIFNSPKDIVSGDFYWINTIEDEVCMAVADCTGHGVPGALLTMVGIIHLTEIFERNPSAQPNKVLNDLKMRLLNTFQVQDKSRKTSDGMEITYCRLNMKNLMLSYASANMVVFVVRDGELIELKGDRTSLGMVSKNRSFVQKSFQLRKNDSVYMFTDGYADQFGGDDYVKLKLSNFKKKIISISHFPMIEQGKKLEQFLDRWKGAHEQIDDILIVGFKL